MGKFSKYLETCLKGKSVTQAELARRIGLKRQNYINNILAGMHTPTINRVEQISSAINCTGLERLELIRLASEERMPHELKKHPFAYNIRYCHPASDIRQLSNLSVLRESKVLNEHLLDSFVFKMEGDFLEPLVKKGQRAILSYRAPVDVGDAAILEISCRENKYHDAVKAFVAPSPIGAEGWNTVAGILEKRDLKKGELRIRHLQHPKRVLTVLNKYVGTKTRIMGILF